MTNKEIENLVYNYPTKSKYGFNRGEAAELREKIKESHPHFSEKKYFEAQYGDTCMMEDGEIIHYHCDVLRGILCGIENRSPRFEEWD